MDVETPAQSRGGRKLDSPPPRSDKASRKSLMDLTEAKEGPKLGAASSNPQVMAIHGMAMAERGLQMIAASVPSLAQMVTQAIATLRQMVPQAIAGPTGVGMPPGMQSMPAGVMPAMSPPPHASGS